MVALDAHFPRAAVTVASAVYGVYCAKKSAELAHGVGSNTEIAVLKEGRDPVFLNPEDVETLEPIRQSLRPAQLSAADLDAIDRRVRDRVGQQPT